MVDRYTKVVLTVIAVCLVYLCVTTTMRPQPAVASVRQASSPIDVNLVSVGGRDFDKDFIGEFHPAVPIKVVTGP